MPHLYLLVLLLSLCLPALGNAGSLSQEPAANAALGAGARGRRATGLPVLFPAPLLYRGGGGLALVAVF